MQTRTLVVLSLSTTAAGLQLSRRDLAQAIGIGAAGALAPAANAADIKACQKGANNCWSTASTDKTSLKPWTFPNKKTAVKELRAALEAAIATMPLRGIGAIPHGPALTVVPVRALEPGLVLAAQLVAYDLPRLEADLWVHERT